MNEPPTRGQPHCARCSGNGFVVRAEGELAVASVCSCVAACERCGGTGRVIAEVNGERVMGRCRCQILPDRVRQFCRAAIPARHAGSTLLTFDKTADGVMEGFVRAFGWLEAFKPDEPGQGLVLWGQVGRGKTHLLAATLRELVFRHGVEVRFVEFTRLLSLLKEGYSEGRSDAPVFRELSTVAVLGIDELGKGRLSEFELAVIDEVVSRRYNAMGCTLATTNYPPGEPTGAQPPNLAEMARSSETLGDRVGARVYSRLREMVRFVEIKGGDYRGTKRAG